MYLMLFILIIIIVFSIVGGPKAKKILKYPVAFFMGIIPAIVILFSLMTDGMNEVNPMVISVSITLVLYSVLGYIYGYFYSKPFWLGAILISLPGIFMLLIGSGEILSFIEINRHIEKANDPLIREQLTIERKESLYYFS